MNLPSAMRLSRRRSIDIAVRTAHIGAMAVLVGGQHFDAASAPLRPWHLLTVLTGVALLASEASHSRHWVYQARGLVSLAHVAAVGAIVIAPGMARAAIAAALIIGSVGSHLPRSVRKWSLRHGRIVD